VEIDFKRIVALSTLSQLGLIGVSISLGLYFFCFYHLLLHAVFKSLLFLCVGVILHSYKGSQDSRGFNISLINSSLLCVCIIIALIRLRGIPFICGFYSKDIIMETGFYMCLSYFFILFMYFSLIITLLYSVRFLYYILYFSKVGGIEVHYTLS